MTSVGGDEGESVEVEAVEVPERNVVDAGDWILSPLPSSAGRVRWSRSRSRVIQAEATRDAQLKLRRVNVDGDSTIFLEEIEEPVSPSPRRTRTASLPSLPPPLPRTDTTFTVFDTPFPVASASLVDLVPVATVEEPVVIDLTAARSVSVPDSLFSISAPPSIIPLSSSRAPSSSEGSLSVASTTEPLLPSIESDSRPTPFMSFDATPVKSAYLAINASDTTQIGYEFSFTHQTPLAEDERRIEFTIRKHFEMDITAWNADGHRVALEIQVEEEVKGERVVVVRWAEPVKDFIFSTSLIEGSPGSMQRLRVETGGSQMGLRSMRLGFAVAFLNVSVSSGQFFLPRSNIQTDETGRADHFRVSALADVATGRTTQSLRSSVIWNGLRRYHLPRMSTISLSISPIPPPTSSANQFTARNIFLFLFGIIFIMNALRTPSKRTFSRKPALNKTSNLIKAKPSSISQSSILFSPTLPTASPAPPQVSPLLSNVPKPLITGLTAANDSKLPELVRRKAIQLYHEGRQTLYEFLRWLAAGLGR